MTEKYKNKHIFKPGDLVCQINEPNDIGVVIEPPPTMMEKGKRYLENRMLVYWLNNHIKDEPPELEEILIRSCKLLKK